MSRTHETSQGHPRGVESYFIDAQCMLERFRQLVGAPTLSWRLLFIHGIGGVGKSSLLRMFWLHCREAGIPVALAAADQVKSSTRILCRWSEDLRTDGIALRTFQNTLNRLRSAQAKADQHIQRRQGTAGRTARAATKVAAKTAEAAAGAAVGAAVGSVLPGVGTLVGAFGGALVGTGAEGLADLATDFLPKPDSDLLHDPASTLTHDFLSDLARAAARQRLVLMLDAYERLMLVDKWACNLAELLHPNVLLVVAGQLVPDWGDEWPMWLACARVEELVPMTVDQLRVLVRNYYSTIRSDRLDDALVESIVSYAHGLPIVATSAVRLLVQHKISELQQVGPHVVAHFVERLLDGVPDALARMVEAVSTLRWVDRSVLRAAAGTEVPDTDYHQLQHFPFTRPTRQGKWTLHEVIRDVIHDNLWVQDPERFAVLHQRTAAYFERRTTDLERSGRKWQAEYRSAWLERVYHTMLVDEKSAIRLVLVLNENRHHVDFLEELFADVAQWEVSTWARRWILFADALFQAWAKWDLGRAEQALGVLYRELRPHEMGVAQDMELLASVCHALGAIEFSVGRLDAAIEHLGEALALSERVGRQDDVVWALASLGGANLRRGDYAGAIEVLERAAQLAPAGSVSLGEVLLRLGDAHRRGGACGKALECFQRALAILARSGDDEAIAIAQGWVGDALRSQMRWDEAGEWYRRSLETLQQAYSRIPQSQRLRLEIGNPKYNLARVYLEKGEVDDALRLAEEVGRLWKEAGAEPARLEMVDRLLGRIYHATGEFDKARQHYLRSLDVLASAQWVSHKLQALLFLTALDCDQGHAPSHLIELEQLALSHSAWEQLAELRLLQGNTLLRELRIQGRRVRSREQLGQVARKYSEAMAHAVSSNRFVLDTIVHRIIRECKEAGREGRMILRRLLRLWQAAPNAGEAPLVEKELAARQREPGNGSPQRTASEQIAAALSTQSHDSVSVEGRPCQHEPVKPGGRASCER